MTRLFLNLLHRLNLVFLDHQLQIVYIMIHNIQIMNLEKTVLNLTVLFNQQI